MKASQTLSCLFVLLLSAHYALSGGLHEALDGMQELMTGHKTFQNQKLLDDLHECINKIDPEIEAAQDAQWQGFIDYGNRKGNPPEDPWLQCQDPRYIENNCTYQSGTLAIWEPCNYASNVAYYHTAIEVCKKEDWTLPEEIVSAMFENFAQLAQASSFWHGSNTQVGGKIDARHDDLFAYVAYQGMVAQLEPLNSSLIHELSLVPRAMSAVESTLEVRNIYLTADVADWYALVQDIDVPEIRVGMCGVLGAIFAVTIPDDQTIYNWADYLLTHLEGITPEIYDFCYNQYLPAILDATSHISLTEEELLKYQKMVGSIIVKLLYSLIWQEEVLFTVDGDYLYSEEANQLGAALIPIVNRLSNRLHDFEYYNPDLNKGVNIYPGDEWCNPTIPHAKYHLETGVALTDVLFAADQFYNVLRPADAPDTTTVDTSTTSGQTLSQIPSLYGIVILTGLLTLY